MIEGLLQPSHLILILALVLILFGAGKLPDTMAELGKGLRTFRQEADRKTAEAPSSATCASCGNPVIAGAKFCTACGKAL